MCLKSARLARRTVKISNKISKYGPITYVNSLPTDITGNSRNFGLK